MPQLLDTRSEAAWVGVQSEEGTPGAIQKRLQKVGGSMEFKPTDGSAAHSDGERYTDAEDFRDTQIGEGSPAAKLQPGPTALLVASHLGEESVSESAAGTGLYDHKATVAAASRPLTYQQRVGQAVGPVNQKYADCYQGSLRLEASSANKSGVITPAFVSIDDNAAEIFGTDPAVDFDTDPSLKHTDGEGRYTIDGEVFRGTSQWAVVFNDSITPRYGDSVKPTDIGFGGANIAIEGLTISLNEQGLAKWFEHIYGVTEPASGAVPLDTIPGLGSLGIDLRQGNQQRVKLTGSPTGGDFALLVGSRKTAPIASTATPAQVQSALEAIIGRGRVTCSGTALPGGTVIVVFRDSQPTMTKDAAGLTGGTSPDVSITDDGYYRGLKIEAPAVKWSFGSSPAGSVDGGNTEMAVGAELRNPDTGERITVTTRNGDSTSYLAV